MGFWNRFAEGTPQRRVAEHWFGLFQAEFATIEETFRAALSKNEEAFRAGLSRLHPPDNGQRTCLILLAKLALAVHHQSGLPGGGGAGRSVYDWQLQELASRFSNRELERLWRRFEPIDEALRSDASRHVLRFPGADHRLRVREGARGDDGRGDVRRDSGSTATVLPFRSDATFRLKPVSIAGRH